MQMRTSTHFMNIEILLHTTKIFNQILNFNESNTIIWQINNKEFICTSEDIMAEKYWGPYKHNIHHKIKVYKGIWQFQLYSFNLKQLFPKRLLTSFEESITFLKIQVGTSSEALKL